jgi:CBS domain-containing protein
MRIADIHKEKNVHLEVIAPECSVRDAIRVLCEHNIGALPVVSADGTLVGIITERDVLRLCAEDECEVQLTQCVEEVMTRDLVVAVPEDDIDYAMRVMTKHRVRHLPVLENRRLVGIISIGDLVKSKHEENSIELRHLREYLCGTVA